MAKRRPRTTAEPPTPPKTWPVLPDRRLLVAIALALTVLVFLPSLRNGFVALDDPLYVENNPAIAAFTWDNVRTVFNAPFAGTYLPLTMLSYMVDYRLFGLVPFGYHFTNLLFHVLATLLVFLVAERLAESALVGFITATLFGIHTLHVESVAWIAERKDVLYGVGFLGALYLYLSHVKTGRTFSRYYWASLIVFLLASLAKAQAVLLPMVLVLVDVVPRRDFRIKTLLAKTPFFVPAIAIGAYAVVVQKQAGAIAQLALPVDRVLLASHALVNYLWRMMLPIRLSPIYPYPMTDGQLHPSAYASALVLVAVAWAAIRVARGSRVVRFGLLFFAVTIAPFLQIVPLGSALYADRYTYVSSIGLFLAAAVLFEECAARVAGNVRRMIVGAGVVYLAFLSINTLDRTRVWKDSLTLTTDGITKEPTAVMLYDLRAQVYLESGDVAHALEDWNSAVQLAPLYALYHARRGDLRLKYLKDFALAAEDYSRVIALEPRMAEGYYARASAYGQLGKTAEAMDDVNTAIEIKPNLARAYVVRGILYLRIDRPDMAIRDLTKAIELAPDYANAYFNRSIAYDATRAFSAAYADALKAAQLGFSVDRRYLEELAAHSSGSR